MRKRLNHPYFLVYQAWSSIVYQLIPNVTELEDNLSKFADIIDGDEVLLFERATFLVSKPIKVSMCVDFLI